MRRTPGLLAKLDAANVDNMIASLRTGSEAEFNSAVDRFLYPGRSLIQRMTDDDLAELAGRSSPTKLVKLAESEMRSREAWRGPARWSLIISALALAVSVSAFIRTF